MTAFVFPDWSSIHPVALLRAAAILGLGLPLVRFAGRGIRKGLIRHASEQDAMVLQKMFSYSLTAILVVIVMHQLGFNLSALLGAAGIFGVAVGFASQTSLSNVISGLFLVGEKPFQVGGRVTSGRDRRRRAEHRLVIHAVAHL